MELQSAVDNLYKNHFGRLMTALMNAFPTVELKSVEDALHDAFSASLVDWREKGIPLNPVGWVFKVSRNRLLNQLRATHRTESLPTHIGIAHEPSYSESVFDDHRLTLLFACAHPDLAPKIQVAMTLKYVANLKVEAIASCLAMTIDGVDKLLTRARQKIKRDQIALEEPSITESVPRIPIVHKIIYLIFSEGYKTSWGKELIREELCEDALLMAQSLLKSPLAKKETNALFALMLFNSARFQSRFDAAGELVDLENQNRNAWNHEMIALGTHYLTTSRTAKLSAYHLEAYIAYQHCVTKRFEYTDWPMITQLYILLLKENPNPFIQLNYAIALYHAGSQAEAFGILLALRKTTFFKDYYLLNLTLGKLYFKSGQIEDALRFISVALTQTNSEKEKNFIIKLLAQVEAVKKSSANSYASK